MRSPANLPTNLTNGALGYFFGCSVDTKGLRVQ